MASTSTPAQASKKASHLPNDARLIALLLASRGVEDADERVLHQLLDFAHRYTTELFKDANAFAQYDDRSALYGPGPDLSNISTLASIPPNPALASGSGTGSKKGAGAGGGGAGAKNTGAASGLSGGDEGKGLKVEDVEMAVRARSGWEFQEGAPKDYLLPLARQLNALPLPILPESHSHIRLPPRSQMLGTLNFEFVPNKRPGGVDGGLYEDEDGEGESDVDAEGEEEDDGESDADAMPRAGPSGTGGQTGLTGNFKRKRSDRDDGDGGEPDLIGEDDIDVEDEAGGMRKPDRNGGHAGTNDAARGDHDDADGEVDAPGEEEMDDDDEDMEEVPTDAAAEAVGAGSTAGPAPEVQKRQVEEDDDYDAE